MNKYKKLVGNSVIFAIGNLGSKLVQFILIPLYSYTMSTSQFGKADLLTQLVFLLTPILSLELFDAVFRFALDEGENTRVLFSSSFYVITAIMVVVIGLSYGLGQYLPQYPIALTGLLLGLNIYFALVSNFARARGYVKEYAVSGIINTLVMGSASVIFLVLLHGGIRGYLWAYIVGLFVATLYIFFSTKTQQELDRQYLSKGKLLELLKYSLPLIPNYLAWWLNSASDRVFILTMVGAGANGIYAMANKIPNLLNLVTQIFSQSWQISVVEEYRNQDSRQFLGNVLDAFIGSMFLVGILAVTWIKLIFKVAIDPAYYPGWSLTPALVLAAIYAGIAIILETVFTAYKETVTVFLTTLYGAIVNVVVTVILIKGLGSYGAAIANVVSFALVVLCRAVKIAKKGILDFELKRIGLYHLIYALAVMITFSLSNEIVLGILGTGLALGCALINPRVRRMGLTWWDKVRGN